MKDATAINLSLFHLARVVQALVDDKKLVPYKASKLTRVLANSLGGNSLTSVLATCSPAFLHVKETVSTCRFALACSKVKNRIKTNSHVVPRSERAWKKKKKKKKKKKIHYPWDDVEIEGTRIRLETKRFGTLSGLSYDSSS